MTDQTQGSQAGDGRRPARRLRNEFRSVTRAAVTLTKLQSRLCVQAFRATAGAAKRPTLMLGIACVLILSAAPVCVLGLAYLLAWSGLSIALCILLTAAFVLAATLALGVLSWQRMKVAFAPVQRSRQEMTRNLNLIKGSLKRHRSGDSS